MERIRKESGAAVMVTLQQEYYYKYLLKVRMILHYHHHHHQSHPNGNTVRKLIEVRGGANECFEYQFIVHYL